MSLYVDESVDVSEYVHTMCNAVSSVVRSFKLTLQLRSMRNCAVKPSPRLTASIRSVLPYNGKKYIDLINQFYYIG